MDDYFGFFKHAVHVALDEVHAVHDVCTGETTDIIFDKMALIHKLNDLSLSTSYSGVGSPETCLHTLCHYIKEATGLQPAKPSILFQVEYDASCREELQLYNSLGSAGKVRDSEKSCLFGDLNEFWHPDLQPIIQRLQSQPDLALELLAKAVGSGEACRTYAWCHSHRRICHLILGGLHLGGV